MKRYGNLWTQISDRFNVERAIFDVIGLTYDDNGNVILTPRKEYTRTELYYYLHYNEIVDQITLELQSRCYDFGQVRQFKDKEGAKIRIINHLDKHGTILINAVMRICQPLLLKKFIPFTYSSIVGRGLIPFIVRVHKFIRKHPDYYYYQSDVEKCYQSTNQSIALEALKRVIKDKYVIEFFENLFPLISEGLAIGFGCNHHVMSLIFSRLDHRMIDEEGFSKGYNRYMDDTITITPSLDRCIKAYRIHKEEYGRLNLTLKSNGRIARVSDGIDCCGYIIYPTHIRLRKRIKNNLKAKDAILRALGVDDYTYKMQMASYYGWTKWGDCRNLEDSIFKSKALLFRTKFRGISSDTLYSTISVWAVNNKPPRFLSIQSDVLYKKAFDILDYKVMTTKTGNLAIAALLRINDVVYFTVTASQVLYHKLLVARYLTTSNYKVILEKRISRVEHNRYISMKLVY